MSFSRPLPFRALRLLLVGVLAVASLSTAAAQAPSARAARDYDIPQVREINARVRAVWNDFGLAPAPSATDGEWCRRVFLDLIGRVPSVDELNAFLATNGPDKKRELVKSLLHDNRYASEYARHWTTIWTNLLIGRSGGTEANSLTNRAGMQRYLRESFAQNKPYDSLVKELVTATGSNSPEAENFNGAVNFLIGKLDENAAQATAQSARLFLGMQVQCTQCHNHPFNEWKQRKFWELNAFFRQTRSLRTFVAGTRDLASVRLVNEDFGGESGSASPSEAAIFYELRNGQTKVAFPRFVDDTAISTSGYLSDVDRRKELGQLIVNSPALEQALVNRLWAHFLGYGFTKPIDDMGPHNLPSHPELLAHLGQEFRGHSFNLKELMTWIVLSEPYALSSKTTAGNKADDPLAGKPPKFSRFYLRQMSAEELYESLLVATEAHKTGSDYEQQEEAKRRWLAQFVLAFGTDEGDESTTFNGTIPQALMLFNGDLIKQATAIDKGSFLGKVAAGPQKPVEKINRLFLAALARKPTAAELDVAEKLRVARQGDSAAALQDMWWAVLNSNEFILNH